MYLSCSSVNSALTMNKEDDIRDESISNRIKITTI